MMTYRFAKCAVAIGAIGLAGVLQSSAQAANTTATAAAVVATAITITKTVDMDFGTVAEDGVTPGSTVTLATDGSRTTGGGASVLAGSPGAAASFNVGGEGNNTYSISFTGDPVTLNSGGNTMTATSFVSLPSGTGTLSAGSQVLLVGATLSLAIGQATGTYLSTTPFGVTVNYN